MHEYKKLFGLIKAIAQNNVDYVLNEIATLIRVLLTIPMSTSEPERCLHL